MNILINYRYVPLKLWSNIILYPKHPNHIKLKCCYDLHPNIASSSFYNIFSDTKLSQRMEVLLDELNLIYNSIHLEKNSFIMDILPSLNLTRVVPLWPPILWFAVEGWLQLISTQGDWKSIEHVLICISFWMQV